jgi:cytochrome c-type biogenesis protein CcmH/NrfF
MNMLRLLIVPIIALLVGGGLTPAWAESSLDASQKARYQKLCESLVAPCCWGESLAVHRSPASLQARDEVAALILQGKSDGEILQDLAARYGPRVLIEPTGSRARWLYVLPLLALWAGLWGVIHFLRTRVRTQVTANASPPANDDSMWDW